MTSYDESLDINTLAAGDTQVLAMAYVPNQPWGDLYDETVALQRGTLFPELDKPFTGRKQVRHG